MIVYNVKRRWFAHKLEAESYRVALRLKPDATAKIEVKERGDLAALLNALCEPASAGSTDVPAEVIDRAFVPPQRSVPDCVPDFLLSDEERRQRREVSQ